MSSLNSFVITYRPCLFRINTSLDTVDSWNMTAPFAMKGAVVLDLLNDLKLM